MAHATQNQASLLTHQYSGAHRSCSRCPRRRWWKKLGLVQFPRPEVEAAAVLEVVGGRPSSWVLLGSPGVAAPPIPGWRTDPHLQHPYPQRFPSPLQQQRWRSSGWRGP